MFKKKTKIYTEIDEDKLKKLKLFESVDGNFNELGFNVLYTRIPGGVIRTVLNPESINQLFIPLQNSYFI
jgi:hypothetical protein